MDPSPDVKRAPGAPLPFRRLPIKEELEELQSLRDTLARGGMRTLGPPTWWSHQMPDLVVEVLHKCLERLEAEGPGCRGIFRQAGNAAQDRALLRHQLVSEAGRAIPPEYSVTVVADVLKALLRRLPESLFTNALCEHVLDAAMVGARQPTASRPLTSAAQMLSQLAAEGTEETRQEEAAQLSRLQALVWLMPRDNRLLIDRFMRLMRAISDNAGMNKMDLRALALVTGPNLLAENSPEQLRRAQAMLPALFEALLRVSFTDEDRDLPERQLAERERVGRVRALMSCARTRLRR